MSGVYQIQPARDLPSGRLAQRREHLRAEIVRDRESDRAPAPMRLPWLHRRKVVVLAAVALLAVGTACAFGVRALVLETGSTALPPEGATPSIPATGELVLHYDGRPELSGFPGRFVPVNQVWVYADGRMIWRREGGPFGVDEVGTGEVRTGFLEQRLTREGVELLRSEIISTGLFDRDREFREFHHLSWGTMQVRNGERLVNVVWGSPAAQVATPEQASALSRLTELVADPAPRLPASAWEDREIKAYVPSKYAICYRRPWEPPVYTEKSLEPARAVSFLPAAAQDVLRGKDRPYQVPNAEGTGLQPGMCSEVTTGEARALAEILSQAGFQRDPLPDGIPQGTWYNARFRTPAPIDVVIWFEPILPHGQWSAMGG